MHFTPKLVRSRRWLAITATSVGSVVLLTAQQRQRIVEAEQDVAATSPYSHVLSSGTFSLPSGAKSVDWIVLNSSPNSQQIRVTVYSVSVSAPKTIVAPGAITTTIAPNTATHNANGVGSVFTLGGTYEVVVETNDTRVLPSIDVWATNGAIVIPGTHLSPRDFTDVR